MADAPVLERLLRRDGAITIAALVILCCLAWAYILAGAGLGMSTWDMTRLSLFPYRLAADTMFGMPRMAMPSKAMAWDLAGWGLMIAMWWTMMVAMMAPSAAPTVLLYARVHRNVPAQDRAQRGLVPTGAFAAGYLLVWLAFSVAAAALHWFLQWESVVSATMMASRSRWLSAGILLLAGLYQLSPLKSACLAHCRAPASFLSRHWRPGASGALRLGAMHGAYCVACCWALMALLFVGGVMNFLWIAALALLVMAEKLLPRDGLMRYATSILLIGWSIATLAI